MFAVLWSRARVVLASLAVLATLCAPAALAQAPQSLPFGPSGAQAQSGPAPVNQAQADFTNTGTVGQPFAVGYGIPAPGPFTSSYTGALPPGVTYSPADSNGVIYFIGTPTGAGTFSGTLNYSNANGSASATIDFVIAGPNLALSPSGGAVATGRINVPGYSQQFTASGGTAPYSYAVTSGALPSGLSLSTSTGAVTGTPTQAGTFNFQITATDSTTGTGAPFSVTGNYSVTIYDVVQVTNASPLPSAQVGAAYSQQMTATGGNGPAYTFAVTFGSLPAGLTLTSAGLLSGTPTQGGDFFFTISATDPGGVSRGKNFQLAVTAPTIGVQPNTLNNGTVAQSYNQTLAAAGGTAPYSFAVTSGALPAGVTLAPNGALSGTPTAGGTFNFTVTATDSSTGTGAPYTGSRAYSWTINGATLAMSPASGALPSATMGTAYTQTFTASNGVSPYSYSVFSGALPAGLTLSSNGVLSGTPTVFGAFSFAIRASDSATGSGPYTVLNNYTLNIAQAVPVVTSISPDNGTTAGGTTVIITGTNFQNASAVTFGGTAATAYNVDSPTQITATTPAHAAGAVNVAVTTPGGSGTLAGGFTYVAPGQVRFVVNTGDDDGSFAFTSVAPSLNFTIQTSGGTGTSPTVTLQPGSYSVAFTVPDGFGLDAASCSPATSMINTSSRTAALIIASNVTTVCTIQALGSRRAAVEAIGAALDASSRLILANAPDLSRRIGRLNGGGGSGGSASAFGKTFASNLPFSATIGADQAHFAMSLSGLRARGDRDHRFNAPVNDNGVPASLAASVEPASGAAITQAGAATAAAMDGRTYRFDAWVEGTFARFDGAASSEGDFAIIHAGADYLVSDNVLLGVGIQGDWLNMDTASGTLDSSGWLAGPYLSARIAPNLYVDARAAWGGASFDVSPFGTYTDTVDSDRELYSAALIGAFESGNLTVRPEARVSWYKETTDAYVDSLSVAIPSVEIKTGEVTFGPTFEWAILQPSGATLKPSFGFDIVWTFQQDNTATQFTGAPGLDDTGVRGRVEGGLAYQAENGLSVAGSLFYDGIGGGDYDAWGGRAAIAFGF